jgi:Tol biopolymer transport system component/DNA-binding winged helix-turn-helix (wHTH) protein
LKSLANVEQYDPSNRQQLGRVVVKSILRHKKVSMATTENSSVIQFGLYEADLQARELRKSGVRIKLQEQPFQILATLLERPGEIVPREELHKRLWPADTYVDFDLSLNSAVKKLRQALNDDSDNPRFIETLYRRGYRFIGPVNGTSKTNGSALHKSVNFETQVPVPFPESAPVAVQQPILQSKRYLVLAGALALLVALIAARFLPSKPIQALGYTQITHDGRLKGGTVTDGQRLYFNELREDHFVAAQVSASGGDTVVIPTPFHNVGIGDIAPDGSALLLANVKTTEFAAALWSLPLPAGPPRRLSDLPPNAATLSPDGSQLVFAKGSAIYLAKSDGTEARQIATANGSVVGMPYSKGGMVTRLRFSPDGQRLRFAVSESGTASQFLWEMKRDGSGVHQLLPGWDQSSSQCCGNWTRDGKYYVFQSWIRGKTDVWVLPEKAHWFSPRPKPLQLTNGPLQFSFPVPSEDGRKIFMVGSQPRAELQRFDPKLGWVSYLGGASAIDLAFSPDGQWVAYVSIPDFTLWRSRSDGSSPMQLTSSLYAELPRWSPDGRQIAFMGRTDKTNFRAFVVSANGGQQRELIPGAKTGFDPGWSADGKSIVLSMTDPVSSSGHGSLLPSDMDGGISILDLTTNAIHNLPGSENFFSPRPSPDGKYIAAITRNSDRLVLFDLASQRWSDLTTPPFGPVGYPSWSRDGQYIYFDTTFGEDRGIFRIRVADHKLEKISSMEGVQRFEANFGLWSGLAPDDSPLVARDISNQEIYALEWQAP